MVLLIHLLMIQQLFGTKKCPDTEMDKFKKIIEEKYGKKFDSYWDFHQWSVENYTDFWKEMWHYFEVIASVPYEQAFKKTGKGILDCEWFPGAALNYAENILRIRDDRVAIICLDEVGNEDSVTFAEMYEEVKTVRCCIPKTWLDGRFKYSSTDGSKNSNCRRFLSKLRRKYYPIDNLASISESLPNMKTLVIVPTVEETLSKDLSKIPKRISRNWKDTLTEKYQILFFEQLPFNHPISINFTSGTTGLPKGSCIQSCSKTFLALLRDFIFHLNLKVMTQSIAIVRDGVSGIIHSPLWHLGLSSFCLIFDGSQRRLQRLEKYYTKYKITYAFPLSTTYFDGLELMKVWCEPDVKFNDLKVLTMGASPVKRRNYDFIYKKPKDKDFW
ncbi:acetoacetyl-CoA synthetase [Caerostris extrusa]|uniref:Acetoacetyl-CoA synthetase n=1 Tax=Caerostris extrusa TaxID=172846 RepID=A0AAV4XCF4_CAEEX|nr:acetoacetyl-CoA synthetase [Caerostris extrusa]